VYKRQISVFSMGVVFFVTISILAEFWRGTRIRMTTRGENPLTALFKLVANNRRRFGGYIIHLGVVMIALGFIGDAFFKSETQGTLSMGESITIGEYSLRFDGLESYIGSDGREIVEANTVLFKNGQPIKDLSPRRDYFVVQEQPVSIAGVYSTPAEDVYVLLVGWETVSNQSSTFKIYVNPLINWVWIGGFVLAIGVLIGAWSQARGKVEATYSLKNQQGEGLGALPAAQTSTGD